MRYTCRQGNNVENGVSLLILWNHKMSNVVFNNSFLINKKWSVNRKHLSEAEAVAESLHIDINMLMDLFLFPWLSKYRYARVGLYHTTAFDSNPFSQLNYKPKTSVAPSEKRPYASAVQLQMQTFTMMNGLLKKG